MQGLGRPVELSSGAEAGVEACERLLSFERSMPVRWFETTEAEHERNMIQEGTVMRANSTMQAVVLLARAGYGLQVEMLTRSLLEDMLVAHWVAVHDNPGQVVARLDDHRRHREVLRARALPTPGVASTASGGSDVDRLDGLFGRHGEKPWFGMSLYLLLQAVRQAWVRQGRRADRIEALNLLFRSQRPELNAVLHHGGPGLDAISVGTGDDRGWHLGPTVERVEAAAWAAFDVHLLHLQLHASHYVSGHEVDDQLFALARLRDLRRPSEAPEGA